MVAGQGIKYTVDLVMCIDATGSMHPIIDQVKSEALNFYSKLEVKMEEKKKKVDQIRVKVIVFRDYYADEPDKAMVCSEFFDLRSQSPNYANFVSDIEADGGGDEPENGLEALALAINSNWETGQKFSKQRQVIVIYTDASAHSLDKGPKPSHYPNDIAKTLDELTDQWSEMPDSSKRLLLFAPDASPWTVIGNSWENTIHYISKGGDGLQELEMEEILNVIANSI